MELNQIHLTNGYSKNNKQRLKSYRITRKISYVHTRIKICPCSTNNLPCIAYVNHKFLQQDNKTSNMILTNESEGLIKSRTVDINLIGDTLRKMRSIKKRKFEGNIQQKISFDAKDKDDNDESDDVDMNNNNQQHNLQNNNNKNEEILNQIFNSIQILQAKQEQHQEQVKNMKDSIDKIKEMEKIKNQSSNDEFRSSISLRNDVNNMQQEIDHLVNQDNTNSIYSKNRSQYDPNEYGNTNQCRHCHRYNPNHKEFDCYSNPRNQGQRGRGRKMVKIFLTQAQWE